ncbi:NAD(P)/FAD-dependent oxidoreductase [Micromonospora sp. NPDC005173]|uniref:flavin-containing monooxygenase n=1 Tax=Micromonospora sp. NPDC005173 TaxID=3157165 RepID=UPI0033B3B865
MTRSDIPAPECLRVVTEWLQNLEAAMDTEDLNRLADLFMPNADWRDLVSFTWDVRTTLGGREAAAGLIARNRDVKAHAFTPVHGRTPPRVVVRADDDVVEGLFTFETAFGHGTGVLRLDLGAGLPLRARTLLTTLQDLTGFEERRGANRPHGTAYSRTFGGKNWLDLRQEEQRYDDRSPEVLIVGAGQAGLSIAARLRTIGVDALIVDKHERVGDVWRKRYHSLTLHNESWVASLPYLPYPDTWPTYIPKDKLANWFEHYADIMELNVWTATEFAGGTYDEGEQTWTVTVRRDGAERILRPRHVVIATGGVSGVPNRPRLPGLENFRGDVLHSTQYTSGTQFQNRKALVIGTGTSGHDVAQDLHALGSDVVIVQRQPTTVVSLEPSGIMVYALYSEGTPTEDVDLIAAANSFPTLIKANQILAQRMLEADKEILDRLHAVGFRTDIGEDGTGFHLKYNRRGGGYYINVGCSELIADGEIGLLQADQIASFTPQGIELVDGTVQEYDLVVLATGYRNQQEEVRLFFGDAVAEKVGPIWGVDDGGEMRNMWRPTAQRGLWFNAGSLAACRGYSKYLAVQIKAALQNTSPGYQARPHA